MKRIFTFFLTSVIVLGAKSQTADLLENQLPDVKAFDNLSVSVNAGTTGIGLDVATKISNVFQVRVGASFMPEYTPTLTFGIEGGRMDANGQWVSTRFESMADKMAQFTGYEVDTNIDMKGEPNFHNLSVLVDIFPFEKKNWFFTAGFYYGASSIAKAYNTTEDMASLLAVGMYNNMYDKVSNGDPIYGDFYLSPDLEDKIWNMGRMGIRMGEYKRDVLDQEGNVVHKAGEPYMMEPDETCMVKAHIKVNRFKPYLGFGYEGALFKRDPSYRIAFNCGAMFWGGTPSLITHDGTDLVKDIKNVRGKVGRYVDAINAMKVMPVLNISITKRIF